MAKPDLSFLMRYFNHYIIEGRVLQRMKDERVQYHNDEQCVCNEKINESMTGDLY